MTSFPGFTLPEELRLLRDEVRRTRCRRSATATRRSSPSPSPRAAPRGRAGISCFIVERGTPGFHATPIPTIRTSAPACARATFGVRLKDRQVPEGAWKADRGEDARVGASIATRYSSEVLGRVVDAAVQIRGRYGVAKEFPLERWYREARVRRMGEGPSEVHRRVIARALVR